MRGHYILLAILIFATIGTRFSNLMWGNGYFFHPDENNMARAVSHISREKTLEPDFYAYGQFPHYVAAGSFHASQFVKHIIFDLDPAESSVQTMQHDDAIFWLRFWSAAASSITVGVVFVLLRRLTSVMYAIVGSFLTVFAPSLIQSSHYGTTESILTLLFLGIFGGSMYCIRQKVELRASSRYLVLLAFGLGFSIGIKLSSIYFSLPLLIAYLRFLRTYGRSYLFVSARTTMSMLLATILGYIISSPYNILSYSAFLRSMRYEVSVARGLDVFYTRQFIDTNPLIFHPSKTFPYALGWPLFLFSILMGISALIWVLYIRKNKKTAKKHSSILLGMFLVTVVGFLMPTMFLSIRWTRFIIPIVPILIMFSIYALYLLLSDIKKRTQHIVLLVCVGICIIPGIHIVHLYSRPDVRIQASQYIYDEIPNDSYILSETANVVDIPISKINSPNPYSEASTQNVPKNFTVISFDFYHLDQDHHLQADLFQHLERADFIFIPSRRIFANYLRLPERYPLATRYYEALFEGSLGFRLVQVCTFRACRAPEQTIYHLEDFPSREAYIEAMLIGDERAEETVTVFDHPVIRIFEKTTHYTQLEYDNILKQTTG